MFALIAIMLTVALGVAAPSVSRDGTFALQNGTARTQGRLVAKEIGASALDQRLDLWLTQGSAQPLHRYDVDMTKYLHLIAVSDDLTTFLHVHPHLDAAGHFHVDVHFPSEGLYHVYADSEPSGIGQQVFRYDLQVGSSRSRVRDLTPTGSEVSIGPYRVSLSTTHLRAAAESRLTVRITEHGAPADDLHPYLGALAHAVLINTNDLSYAHVHPMQLAQTASDMPDTMPGMMKPPLAPAQTSSPDMMLHENVPEAGTFKIWLQFRGGNRLYVAPFVLTAE